MLSYVLKFPGALFSDPSRWTSATQWVCKAFLGDVAFAERMTDVLWWLE